MKRCKDCNEPVSERDTIEGLCVLCASAKIRKFQKALSSLELLYVIMVDSMDGDVRKKTCSVIMELRGLK